LRSRDTVAAARAPIDRPRSPYSSAIDGTPGHRRVACHAQPDTAVAQALALLTSLAASDTLTARRATYSPPERSVG